MSTSIFCCCLAAPFEHLHPAFFDSLRQHHDRVFTSFLSFAIRSGRFVAVPTAPNSASQAAQDQNSALTLDNRKPEPTPPSSPAAPTIEAVSASRQSPFAEETPYTIHLETRKDFGPVISHRYFVPLLPTATGEWLEATQMEYWQASGNFSHVAAKAAHKCPLHEMFFKMQLKPNLALRKNVELSGVVEGQN